ncbi:Flp pilus assembly protein CpaB [Dermatophilaceae bacterium Soc4.6]
MKARVAVVVVAALVALVGVGALVLYAQGANSRAVAGARPQQVYVADRVVPAGTSLQDAVNQRLLSRTNLPAESTPQGALTQVTAQNKDLVAVNEIQTGEFVLSTRFQPQAVGAQAISVPKGTVAVSAELSDPARVGQFLTPGSHIVIYDTFDKPGSAGQVTPTTEVLLEDVLVIAVGSASLSPTGGDAQSTDAKAGTVPVTVALPPSDSTRLVHAIQTGKLYFGLRGSGVDLSQSGSVSDSSLFP